MCTYDSVVFSIGYETVVNEAPNLMRALQRANPATAGLSEQQREEAAERIYMQSIFGCMAKNAFPVQSKYV